MQAKKNIAILFGGKSAEHEVSLQSAKNIYDALDREKYQPVLIGIDKSGRWHWFEEAEFLLNPGDPSKIHLGDSSNQVALLPQGGLQFGASNPDAPASRAGGVIPIDVIFPILHGPFGEDGTVQGLLKLADIPFVGAGVLGSAVGMDKDVMKRLLRDGGVPIGKFIVLRSHQKIPPFEEITRELGLPFFIKPANMGSSVGVSKIRAPQEYLEGVKAAFVYDRKVIIEEFIQGREIECAVLGNEEPRASLPGEVIAAHDFYSYDAKYLDEQGAALETPANLPESTVREIQALAIKTFEVLECEGLARVDFFLKPDGAILVNEINTMPGFTKISMYPKLWGISGIGYTQLINELIEFAIRSYNKERELKTSY